MIDDSVYYDILYVDNRMISKWERTFCGCSVAVGIYYILLPDFTLVELRSLGNALTLHGVTVASLLVIDVPFSCCDAFEFVGISFRMRQAVNHKSLTLLFLDCVSCNSSH